MIVLVLGLALAAPDHVTTWRDRVDWDAAGDEAVDVLSRYLAVDTVNPPGNEARGVAFMVDILDREAIPWESVTHAPGRSSLIAWLDGGDAEPPLCLLSHLDVVTSELEHWPVDRGPLSGVIADGAVWGRGALDMKGMGAIELMTLVQLRRLGVPLRRDVVLIAVADEEVDNLGMRDLVDQHWPRLRCGVVINEGGIGIQDALFEGQTVHAISVAEKGVLWFQLHADGRAGHGSTPYDGEAPERLLRAMELIDRKWKPKPHIDDSLYDLLDAVGREKGGVVGAILRSPPLVRLLVKGKLLANPATRAAITDTVHLTGMAGAREPNVVPSRVSANYDARLLPGTDPDAVLAELQRITRKVEGLSFEVVQRFEATGSPWDDPFYRAIATYAVEGREGHVAGPVLSVGFTDSIFARPVGARAYGYVPFVVTEAQAGTMHGHGEHVPVDQVKSGLRILFSVVVDQAAEPSPLAAHPASDDGIPSPGPAQGPG